MQKFKARARFRTVFRRPEKLPVFFLAGPDIPYSLLCNYHAIFYRSVRVALNRKDTWTAGGIGLF